MSAPARPFPWEEAMRAGLGLLRLPPDQFWRMTPRELAAALSAFAPDPRAGLDRAGLAALMRRFPDTA
ncbi:MAG TPA: phage tail assembly chaperone [Xanthobacteraceae bacterium]|nr:phage tail assembly chaperone [Xanthobacteraceae bacterium]HQS48964.1 phage tail assembly chaperone [Xanthobacteraceae bacterium]